MKITIKARFSDAIVFEGEYESTRHAVEAAAKSGADLCGANLYGANLCGANLRDANLRDATLYDADLCGANLYGADLCGANLCGANLRDANLCGANLRDADLCDADLYDADLCGANLYGANLCDANLYGADLCDANLYGANLCGANLYGANGEKIAAIRSVLQIGPVGSRKDCTVAIDTDKGIYINAGCFFGTFAEFKDKVKATYKDGQYAAEYKAVIAMIAEVFKARKQ